MNAIFLYKISNWLYYKKIPILPKLIYYLIFIIYNSSIHPACRIGVNTKFAYGGIGVVVHADCIIGQGVMIGQNVTLGGSFGSGVPIIGNNVWISAGARIIGSVNVGNNVIIGANAVVVSNIADNSVAVGIPARVIKNIPVGALCAAKGELIA